MRGWWCLFGVAVCVLLGLSLASAQSTTSYTYDALGRLTSVTSPAGVTTYSYDAAGNRTSVTTDVETPSAEFHADPESIESGSSSTLSWTGANASSVSIDHGLGNFGPSGSVVVWPTTTTTYHLTATGAGGSAQASATVGVGVTGSLSANPPSIVLGNSSTLSWTSTGAASASINNGIGSVATNGNRSVTPSANTTYTLSLISDSGTITRTALVTIQPPTGSLTASPSSIMSGNSSTLSWTSTGATSATIDNGIGSVSPNGTRPVSPSSTTTYHLTLTGPSGTVTPSTTVAVNQQPTASLTASPPSVLHGDSSTLSWTTTNASSGSITDGVQFGTQATPVSSGYVPVTPTGTLGTRTYTLTANGALGSTATSQANVTVYQRPTALLEANPTGVAPGSPSTLHWVTLYASSASIDNGVGSVYPASSGYVTVYPTTTTTYTLTSVGALGSTATNSTTVTVTPVNYPPVANPDEMYASAPFKEAFYVCAYPTENDTDPNNDTLSITGITNPVPGVGTISYGSSYVCLSGQANMNRTSTMTYTLSDGRGGQATGTITIYVSVDE